MPRVIAGAAGGRRIRSLPGRETRPTADRVKEALFNILGERVGGGRVLDLFAGTGNLGIESLSRGARRAVFVDRDARSARLIRENLAELGLGGRAEVLALEAQAAVTRLSAAGEAFDLVFLDPPYGQGLLPPLLVALAGTGVLAPGALVVAEHSRRDELPEAAGRLVLTDRRRYGDTLLSFYGAPGREAAGTGESCTRREG